MLISKTKRKQKPPTQTNIRHTNLFKKLNNKPRNPLGATPRNRNLLFGEPFIATSKSFNLSQSQIHNLYKVITWIPNVMKTQDNHDIYDTYNNNHGYKETYHKATKHNLGENGVNEVTYQKTTVKPAITFVHSTDTDYMTVHEPNKITQSPQYFYTRQHNTTPSWPYYQPRGNIQNTNPSIERGKVQNSKQRTAEKPVYKIRTFAPSNSQTLFTTM
jgi:hypothetical protein